jgi:hypothetical protein
MSFAPITPRSEYGAGRSFADNWSTVVSTVAPALALAPLRVKRLA